MSVPEVRPDEWEERVLRAPVPTLVDVWAPWCLPCKRVEPMLAQVVDRFGDRVGCLRLNADDAPDLVARYEFMSLPTLALFQDGQETGRIAGVPKLPHLISLIESTLGAR